MENLFRARINTGFFRFLIKRNTRLMIITTIGMIALYPLLAFTEFVTSGGYSQLSFDIGRGFQLAIFFISLVIVPFVIFSYLNSKKSLDVYHALPITRKDLFLTGLAASVTIVLIPFITVYGIGWIYNISVIPNVDNILLFQNLYYSLALSLAITLPFMFAMMNTGTSVDGFLYGFIIHLIPMITYGTYLVFGNTVLLGFRAPTTNTFLLFTSPLWTIFEINLNRDLIFPNPNLVSLYWFVMSIGMSWLVLYFYKIRRSEKAETPFTNNKFYPILTSIFIVIVQFFFYSTFTLLTEGRNLDFRTLILPVISTFVGYMILDAIANRGFKNFPKAVIKFSILTLISLIVFVSATLTGGLGYTSFVPREDNIESVEFQINDELGLFSPAYTSYLFNDTTGILKYTDAQDISQIVAFHSTLLERFESLGITSNNYSIEDDVTIPTTFPFTASSWTRSQVQIRYTLNNGATVLRSYQIPITWTDKIIPLSVSRTNLLFRFPHLDKATQVTSLSFAPVSFSQKSVLPLSLTADLFATYLDEFTTHGQHVLEGDTLVGYILSDVVTSQDPDRISSQALPVFASFANTLAKLNPPATVIPDTATFDVVVPRAQNNPVDFFIQTFDGNLRYWGNETPQEFATYTISGSELQQLLPFISAHHINDALVGLVRVNPIVTLKVERNSNFVFYSILEEGRAVFNQIIADKTPTFRTIDQLYFN